MLEAAGEAPQQQLQGGLGPAVAPEPSVQDLAGLLSGFGSMLHDPGPAWTGACLRCTAALAGRREARLAAAAAAAAQGQRQAQDGAEEEGEVAGWGDAVANVLLLCGQYEHRQV